LRFPVTSLTEASQFDAVTKDANTEDTIDYVISIGYIIDNEDDM